jgi:uncharacterized membrane protein
MNKVMLTRFFKHALKGALIIAPLTITLYIIFKVVSKFDAIIHGMGFTVHPLIDPIIGLFSVVVLLAVIGFVGSNLFFEPMLKVFDSWFENMPLVKIIYSSIKDFLGAFMGEKKRFNRPVLVMLSRNPDVEKIGFLTCDDLEELKIGKEKVAVYFPHSYNFSGNLYIVSRDTVTPIEANSSNTMKFIVSGGVTEMDEEHKN